MGHGKDFRFYSNQDGKLLEDFSRGEAGFDLQFLEITLGGMLGWWGVCVWGGRWIGSRETS